MDFNNLIIFERSKHIMHAISKAAMLSKLLIKTHGQKRCVAHKCVIYDNPVSTFSAYFSLKAMGVISIKFLCICHNAYIHRLTNQILKD